MILVDANLLIYAYINDLPQHESARKWLDGQFNQGERVGLPWPSLLAFVRIVSNPRIFERPLGVQTIWQQLDDWLKLTGVWIPLPTSRHSKILSQLLLYAAGRPNLVPDAHLAALAIEHGLTLCSSDGDFARFPDLKWKNPLLD